MGQFHLNYANLIDHTLLKADTKKEAIVKLCEEAKQYGFASVCVNPTWVISILLFPLKSLGYLKFNENGEFSTLRPHLPPSKPATD